MSVLIFTDNPATGETGLVLRELRGRGVDVDYLAPWDISLPGFEPKYELSYVPSNMLHRGSTFELVHRLLILRQLEESGTVVNPVPSMLNYSKEHLTLQLNKLGVSHPETLITENIQAATSFASRLLNEGREVVLKPICMSRGTGVQKLSRIRSQDDLTQYLLWYTRSFGEGVFYLQEYIPDGRYVTYGKFHEIAAEAFGVEAASDDIGKPEHPSRCKGNGIRHDLLDKGIAATGFGNSAG